MQKLLKRFPRALMAIFATFNFALPLSVPVLVHAQADVQGGLCAGANLDVDQTECTVADEEEAEDRVQEIIELVINIFSLVVGIVAVVMIIVGGLKYITSGGDSGNITGAKNTILYAVIGLIVVALAQFIVRFVLGRVTEPTA